MSKFFHDNNDAKPIAIPQVFSQHSGAKNAGYQHFLRVIKTQDYVVKG